MPFLFAPTVVFLLQFLNQWMGHKTESNSEKLRSLAFQNYFQFCNLTPGLGTMVTKLQYVRIKRAFFQVRYSQIFSDLLWPYGIDHSFRTSGQITKLKVVLES